MAYEPKLEQYLSRLDKALGQISVSDRAEIITEIKSHVLESVERNPDQNINQTLAALGEPEAAANRYLVERGLRPGRPAKTPMIKWLTVGFLGTVGMCLIFTLIMVFSFSPIIKIDGEKERVTILGGLIDIDGESGTIKVDGKLIEDDSRSFDGAKNLGGTSIKYVYIPFKNGKLNILPSVDDQLRWNCRVSNDGSSGFVKEETEKFILNFNDSSGMRCDMQVPAGINLVMEGTNGKINFERPHFPVDVRLTNGKISFTPDEKRQYRFDTDIVNGKIEGLKSSEAGDALHIKLAVTNGKISSN